MSRIAVVGSVNLDYFIEVDILPEAGETIMGQQFFNSPGGKGANQAVAASRLSGDVSFFGSMGMDDNGQQLSNQLNAEHVDVSFVNYIKGPSTGVAFIELCRSDNRIVVVPGANSLTNLSYAKAMREELLRFDVILLQLEIPLETIEYIVPILKAAGKTIILNPAPAQKLNRDLIDCIDYITPNEHEYESVFNSNESMDNLLIHYPNKLIITCGSHGVKYYNGVRIVNIPAFKVDSVDTTGAGDTFSGAFALAVTEGKSVLESIQFGNAAASLSVTKKGAQSAMPYRHEVDQYLAEKGKLYEN